jgi:hypothetical protein
MNTTEFRILWMEDELDLIESEADPSWRHGCNMVEVYKEVHSDTYWRVHYQLSGDGEYHGLREEEFDLEQVQPFTETVTVTRFKAVTNETSEEHKK